MDKENPAANDAHGGANVTAQEADAIAQRRGKAGYPAMEDGKQPYWGLALSGGGVRSATFCFGFVRALAKNEVFRRFDYLSTVSGGGYLGSAIGRLFSADTPAAEVEKGLASKDSVLLWWLRNNGRYLTPAGARDLAQAFASVLRGMLSTHFEVGVLLMLASAVMTVFALFVQRDAQQHPASMWFWLLPLAAFVGLHHIFAYWFVRKPRTVTMTVADGVVAAACTAIAISWGRGAFADVGFAAGAVAALSAVACLLLFAPLTALAAVAWRHAESVSEARLRHTIGLSNVLWLVLGLVVAGVVDWLSWRLALYFAHPGQQKLSALIPAVPASLVAVARFVLPYAQGWLKSKKEKKQEPVKTQYLLNAAGMVLLFVLALAWGTVFQFAFNTPWDWMHTRLPAGTGEGMERFLRWLVLGGVPLGYVLTTLHSLQVLNLSSLHHFYRARIERAYVSCGNRKRFDFPAGVLAQATRATTGGLRRNLREAEPDDDIELKQYEPWRFGGPIHLVNCCINQTVDDRTQNYNADRKGVALAVSSFGAETGGQLPSGSNEVPGQLSTWIAVSGAAASSGMGSQTSPGLAALLFLSGLRLGHWTRSLEKLDEPERSGRTRPRLIQAEALARFPGLRSSEWYLSDGGHFENTGVYALLKRRLPLIVVADCGADPEYGYEDIENLVRKAQIDYGADIRFIVPPALAEPPPGQPPVAITPDEKLLRDACGLPAQITKEAGAPFLLLAQVTYDDPQAPKATLVVVKPRCVPDVSLDVSSYAKRNGAFPQQTTADQFFDEAQWEAYHQLGYHLGRWLTAENLARMQDWVQRA